MAAFPEILGKVFEWINGKKTSPYVMWDEADSGRSFRLARKLLVEGRELSLRPRGKSIGNTRILFQTGAGKRESVGGE